MKKLIKFHLSFALVFLFMACEQEVDDIPLPQSDPKLVVYSYISPSDSLIQVEVTKSIPFFSGAKNLDVDEAVTDATVQISSNGSAVQLPYDPSSRSYRIANNTSFPILAGQSYFLTVTAPGGFSVNASTRVPKTSPELPTVSLDSTIRESDGFQEKRYRIITKWKDVAANNNFYHFSLKPENFFGEGYCNDVFSDEGKQGMEISRSCSYTTFFDPTFPNSSSFNGTVYVLTTDVEYYKYHESYYRYNDENPFAEPVRIYSNIEGGLGCFGSYLEQEVSF